jgi:hypothetical protein
VVYEFPIPLPYLGELHIAVFFEVGRSNEIFVRDDPFGGHAVLIGHRNDDIGFSDVPAFNELRSRRQVFGITFWSAGVYPGNYGLNLLC